MRGKWLIAAAAAALAGFGSAADLPYDTSAAAIGCAQVRIMDSWHARLRILRADPGVIDGDTKTGSKFWVEGGTRVIVVLVLAEKYQYIGENGPHTSPQNFAIPVRKRRAVQFSFLPGHCYRLSADSYDDDYVVVLVDESVPGGPAKQSVRIPGG